MNSPSANVVFVAARERIMRLRCWLLGCVQEEDLPECHFCGVYLYGGSFSDAGKLDPLLWRWGRLRRLIRERWPVTLCDQCGKRIFFGRPYTKDFCSGECHDNWLPF